MLPLVKEKGAGGCPKEKAMFKKCKRDNKEDKKSKMTEVKKDKNTDKQGNTILVIRGKLLNSLSNNLLPTKGILMILIPAKCLFSAWDDWTPCRDGNQQRIRKVGGHKNQNFL